MPKKNTKKELKEPDWNDVIDFIHEQGCKVPIYAKPLKSKKTERINVRMEIDDISKTGEILGKSHVANYHGADIWHMKTSSEVYRAAFKIGLRFLDIMYSEASKTEKTPCNYEDLLCIRANALEKYIFKVKNIAFGLENGLFTQKNAKKAFSQLYQKIDLEIEGGSTILKRVVKELLNGEKVERLSVFRHKNRYI